MNIVKTKSDEARLIATGAIDAARSMHDWDHRDESVGLTATGRWGRANCQDVIDGALEKLLMIDPDAAVDLVTAVRAMKIYRTEATAVVVENVVLARR